MLTLLLLAAQAIPAATTPVSPSAASAADDPMQRKVCWRDQATGSMMPPVRMCMTRAERRAWIAKMQGNVNAMLDRRQRAPQGDAGF